MLNARSNGLFLHDSNWSASPKPIALKTLFPCLRHILTWLFSIRLLLPVSTTPFATKTGVILSGPKGANLFNVFQKGVLIWSKVISPITSRMGCFATSVIDAFTNVSNLLENDGMFSIGICMPAA